MPTTDKPMLIATQLRWLKDDEDNWADSDKREAINTIEAAMTLLEQTNKLLGRLASRLEGLPTTQEDHELLLAVDAMLHAYHGTDTSEREGGGA